MPSSMFRTSESEAYPSIWHYGLKIWILPSLQRAYYVYNVVQTSKSDIVTDFFFIILLMTLLMMMIQVMLMDVMLMMMSNSVQFVQVGIFVPRTLLRV